MAAIRERGFKGILLASLFGQCQVPFQCSPRPVVDCDGNASLIEIVNGIGQYTTNPVETGKVKYDHKIKAENRVIKCHNVDSFLPYIVRIVDHLRSCAQCLYDCAITYSKLIFGVFVETEEIFLLRGTITTAPNTFVSFLFRPISGGEEAFVDYLVESVTFSPGSTSTCYSCFPDCLKPKYKCPLLYIIYYFSKIKFPSINAQKLYSLLKIRLLKINCNHQVNICIHCVHIYTLEKRDHQCVKRNYIRDPRIPYESGNHVYERDPPPLPPPKEYIPYIPKPSRAVTKLASGEPVYQSSFCSFSMCSSNVSRSLKVKKNKREVKTPEFRPRESMSIKKAPNLYGGEKPPFSRSGWNNEEIVRRFHTKTNVLRDPIYIEPRDCHMTKYLL